MILLAWFHLLTGAGMNRMDAMGGMDASGSTKSYVLVAAMWSAMMVAMMVPSAAPTILLYGRVHRHGPGGSIPPTAAFLAGYVGCWLGFAVVAAALQLWLEQAALASPMTMTLHSRTAAGGLLIAAGLYQLSPLKDACLSRCRSPAEFLTRHFRPGAAGALRLGMLHGGYCIGCCWMLMALLFVGGVMNLVWIAALTLLVAAEKLLPSGARVALIAGVSMILWGVGLLAT